MSCPALQSHDYPGREHSSSLSDFISVSPLNQILTASPLGSLWLSSPLPRKVSQSTPSLVAQSVQSVRVRGCSAYYTSLLPLPSLSHPMSPSLFTPLSPTTFNFIHSLIPTPSPFAPSASVALHLPLSHTLSLFPVFSLCFVVLSQF